MIECGNMLCAARTLKRGDGSYCFRVDDTRNQMLSNNTGQDAQDPNKSGPFWQNENLERSIKNTVTMAEQEGCKNPFLGEQLDTIAQEKKNRGHVI